MVGAGSVWWNVENAPAETTLPVGERPRHRSLRYRHLRSRRGVSPPLLRSRIRRSCRLSRAGSGANWQLLSSDESDERPKEASTVIKEAAHFVRAYGNSAFYCVVGDGSDRDRGQRYEGVESTKPSVRMEKKWW